MQGGSIDDTDTIRGADSATATVDVPAQRRACRFLFTPGLELTRSTAQAPAPLIADSWFVDDGTVRGLELHEARFRSSCAELLPQLQGETVESFLGQVREALPREGRWFPRIEAHAGLAPQLVLWLREAPELECRTALWVNPQPDARMQPRVKGPDLPALAQLREQARRAGADDALITAADGTVLEAAHSALAWWRGDALCLADADASTLPSVTLTLLVELARRADVAVIRERVAAAELSAVETWTLNALHGIRPVSAWHGSGAVKAAQIESTRAREWSSALEQLAQPIDEIAAR